MSEPPVSRRRFCVLACAAVAMLPLALEAGAPAPGGEAPDPRRVTPETRASLPKGTIRNYRKEGGFYLVADGSGIYAVSAVCTHNGCRVLLEDNKGFGCPCHDSGFDLQGNVVQGPARLPLPHFEVTEQAPGGALVVDLSRRVSPDVRL